VIHRGRQELTAVLRLTRRVMAQTEQRLQGIRPIPDRLVSVFDPQARPICRGKLSAKIEFGYKALITETEERLVAHYEVHRGNPADSALLKPAFAAHVQVIGRTPAVVATDRGFGSKANEAFLAEQRVQKISLPYPGLHSEQRRAHETQRWFRCQQRWRAGQEATISLGRRKYHWRHSRLRSSAGPTSGSDEACWPITWAE
jgi:IS5 family transposase